jgi:hypothetical protein
MRKLFELDAGFAFATSVASTPLAAAGRVSVAAA